MLKGIVGLLQLHKNTACKEVEADYGALYQQEIKGILRPNSCCRGLLWAKILQNLTLGASVAPFSASKSSRREKPRIDAMRLVGNRRMATL